MRKAALIVAVATVAVLTAVPSALASGPHGSIRVGLWQGGAYTNDANGAFSHCSAGVTYKSGINFMVAVNANLTWTLGFAHPSWHLNANETIPIDLTFDNQHQFHVFGNPHPVMTSLLVVPMPNNSALIKAFRNSRAMIAFAKGQQFPFYLNETSVLLPTLVNCVQQVKANGIAHAGDFNIHAAPSAVTAPVASNAGSSLKPETNQPQSQEFQLEAIELASNFLIKAQLHNPQIVNRTETPVELASYGAAWKSEEANGFVRIIPTTPDVKGLDVAATVIGNDAKACKGKFASGRMSELVDSDVVFRGIATCEDSDGSRVAQYFIVPRRKGGFVMFSVQSNMKTAEARSITTEEKLGGFRKAALVAVSQ